MAVYVDTLMKTEKKSGWRFGHSCHLMADTLPELHTFASLIGMKRDWFQDHPTFPHYDLTATRRAEAVKQGAIELSRAEMVRRMREVYGT